MELLDHMGNLFLTFLGTTILFPSAIVPLCSLTNSALGFQFLHLFANMCYFLFVNIGIFMCMWLQAARCFITDFEVGLSNWVVGGTEGDSN